MLNVKMNYIRGAVLAVALLGLLNCNKKSKNDTPVAQEQDQGGTTGGSGPDQYYDPSENPIYALDSIEEDYNGGDLNGNRPIFTEAQYAGNFHYTDNNNDDLVESAKQALAASVNHGDLEKHKEFARRLSVTQAVLDPRTPGDIRVNFKTYTNNSETRYTMTGTLQRRHGNYSAVLRPDNCPDDITVNVQCMDRGNSCHHMVLRFQDRRQADTRYAFAIFRTTPVELKYFIANNQSYNSNQGHIGSGYSQGFQKFYDLLNNTRDNSRHQARIKGMILESSTVVYGMSTFALFTRIGYPRQRDGILPFFGPLIRNRQNNHVQVALRDYRDFILLKDYSPSNYDSLMDDIQRVDLLQNNGRGKIQLQFNFGAQQQPAEAVVLTISRKNVPLRALNP